MHSVIYCKVAFALLVFLLPVASLCQHSVSGKIDDIKTHQSISHASIYFPELHLGQSSSETGDFNFNNLPSGKFLMQVSHVGYDNHFVTLDIPSHSSVIVSLQQSFIQMKEVVVTGNQSQSPGATSFNTSQLSSKDLQQSGTLNISDAIARMPGVSQLTTGAGISKPVIRGLYGNRIQINVNGVRFDNQQWQDEHGLGLNDMGVDRVEIIKGPASVLYGSDAMGGVLNIIEEKPAPINVRVQDVSVRLYSNTFGTSVNYGIKKSTETKWWRIRAGFDSHADYSDGANARVLNSRFASYNLKASVGFNRKNWTNVNNVFVSYSKFGFVFDSLARKENDARASRKFDGPHHQVFFVQGSSENTFFKGSKKIKLNGGVISNLRQEDEGGGGISLSMLLNSISILAQVNQPVGKFSEWIYGASTFLQTNTNFGGRIIIPNATTGEGSLFSLFKYSKQKFLIETGVRYDRKFITTLATGNLNVIGNESPTQEILPFNKAYNAFNASLGATFHVTQNLYLKGNTSSGYRPGNLAELSSNGLHEGSMRWEIGKRDAKIEQNINVEGSIVYDHKNFKTSFSFYNNYFKNYIYLNPTSTEYFGFQIYRYAQSDATLKGGEMMIDWNPEGYSFTLTSAYSFISARKADNNYLPFIPANKFSSGCNFYFKSSEKISNASINVRGDYFLRQSHPAQFETETASYFLLNASAHFTWQKVEWSVIGNNLFNNNYYDHLSRFKYYGIHNMGRNIVLAVKLSF
jgi:iron complex outermembrane receptor protein